jgi:hypothetical protein
MDLTLDMGHDILSVGGNNMPNKIKCSCLECGRIFYVYPSHYARGNVKFCSLSCSTTWRNKNHNPSKDPKVRARISEHHADVSGKNNPMYGVRGENATGYIDGRNSVCGNIWRKLYFTKIGNPKRKCEVCGVIEKSNRFHVHHLNGNRKDNSSKNLIGVCVKCHNNILHERKRNPLGQFQKGVPDAR